MATVTTGQPLVITGQRRITWHRVWTVLVGVFWFAILVGIIGGFFLHWNWTGFPENGKLWDWLQLLSAPVFVSALPLIFKEHQDAANNKAAAQQSKANGGISEEQVQSDLKAEEYRRQGVVLEAYQDHILQFLLDRNLRGSQPGSDVREVARARTLAVLRRVGKNRKGDVVQFLYEAGLIYKGQPIVDLREADLSEADLSNTNLNGSELSGVDLSGARLNGTTLSNARLSSTDLSGADLSGANLSGVDFSNANLTGANLNGAIYTQEQLSGARPYNQRGMPSRQA